MKLNKKHLARFLASIGLTLNVFAVPLTNSEAFSSFRALESLALQDRGSDTYEQITECLEKHPLSIYKPQMQLCKLWLEVETFRSLPFGLETWRETQQAISEELEAFKTTYANLAMDYLEYLLCVTIVEFTTTTPMHIKLFLGDCCEKSRIDLAEAAVLQCERFLNRFPSSPYAASAQRLMNESTQRYTQSLLYLANFAYDTGAILSSLMRCKQVLEWNPESPEGLKALLLMHNIYKELDLLPEAEAIQILIDKGKIESNLST